MTAQKLHDLARAVGLAVEWADYRGAPHTVSDDALAALLQTLGFPAASRADLDAGLDQVEAAHHLRPPLATAERLRHVRIPAAPGRARLMLEDGRSRDVTLEPDGERFARMTAPSSIGYHRLELDDGVLTLATTPTRALRIGDLNGGRKSWGAAAQLYSLNDGGGFGDFGDVAALSKALAKFGADALALSPTHALFLADPGRYAPYGPSTRLFMNPLYAPLAGRRAKRSSALIDWREASEAKLSGLRAAYDAFTTSGRDRTDFEAYVQEHGPLLVDHARFEALDARFRPRGLTHWRDWPDGYADVRSASVQALSPGDPEIEFPLFLQWQVEMAAAKAQAASKAAGMAVGLISDLAVGMDGAGSHAWSRPEDILLGVGIGAPPDLLAREGQSWGLTTFSPWTLRRCAFEPFLATLRAALRHAGGVRIDHVIGLRRLWVSPDGAPASEGAYLRYPFDDLLRLIALESRRHGAIVVGEDLGTVPEGFRQRIGEAGIDGMRVLWFEQTRGGAFRAPSGWGRRALAMTTTHDLPTVAGWWRHNDIGWRARIGSEPDVEASVAVRDVEKTKLWTAMRNSGAASGPRPDPEDTDHVVDAALAHVAVSNCDLALIAMEDLLGLPEQPNMPGLSDPHPNWRRRLPPGNGLGTSKLAKRLKRLRAARGAAR
ncbi:MAG TPA: 4-alpha-glucanotransferase [Caulobacteraceae bacterium]|nr:4-alpha-glucanotransferase [Caulobacteraceae bacterium]